jgi:trigger factor
LSFGGGISCPPDDLRQSSGWRDLFEERVHKLTHEIKEVSSCKRSLVAEVPADQFEEEIDKQAKEYARHARVPGFRPGKVPLTVVRQRFRSELRSDATQEIVRRVWKEALEEQHLHPINEPSLENLSNEPGDPLKFTLGFEVLPSFEARDYKGIPATAPRSEITDKDVDDAVESLRDRNAQYVPIEEGEVRDGELVTLSVEGVFEEGGKPLREENVTCIIGAPETNETFSENLRGARQGETRSFTVEYPADYHRKRYAGKKVHYTANLKEIKEKHLPDLEDLAKELGADSLEELRSRIRDELVTKAERVAEKKARDAVMDEVLLRNSVEVPGSLVDAELEDYVQRIAGNLAQQGIDPGKTSIDWRKMFEDERPNAEKAVRRTLILDAIARQEGLDVTEKDLEDAFEKLAETSQRSGVAIRAQFEKDQKIQSFRDHLRRNKALDFIYLNANIKQG